MKTKKSFFWLLPLAGLFFFVRCEPNTPAEEPVVVGSSEPRECFDYIYPIQVVFEGDTLEVSTFEQYKDLHVRCADIFTDFARGTDPKGRDSNNRVPTGKGHSATTDDGYGDCPRDNDPWCGEMIFPLTITNVPGLEGQIEVQNDSTLQYYRWIVCD